MMGIHLKTIIFTIASLHACVRAVIPTYAWINDARQDILELIQQNPEFPDNDPEYPFIAGFVRLAFHDCVGPGHCDGCIGHNLAENAGLLQYSQALDQIYDLSFKDKMSRADFYALASLVALELATQYTPDKFTVLSDDMFYVGRRDCPLSPFENRIPERGFPSSFGNTTDVLDFFRAQFGFNAEETVAILGAHTLGRMRTENSGFEGKWVQGLYQDTRAAESDVLDNGFYVHARGNWSQVSIVHNGGSNIQWQRPGRAPNSASDPRDQPEAFLNSDLAMLWAIGTPDPNGRVTCTITCQGPGCCPIALRTHQIFRSYTQDNALWLSRFSLAFLKMINHNQAELRKPRP